MHFTSTSGLLVGNSGQANYAAGCSASSACQVDRALDMQRFNALELRFALRMERLTARSRRRPRDEKRVAKIQAMALKDRADLRLSRLF